MRNPLARSMMMAVARRGFVVTRHPAIRRQQVMRETGVDLVLDVGAADGAYGRELRQFGYDGRIVSFEPLSAAYSRLEQASAGDSRWTARRVAVGDRAGKAEINVASNSDSSSLLPLSDAHLTAAPWVTYAGTETVDVVRLDDVAAQLLSSTTTVFLKIDTQGFERHVLDGAAETLRRCTLVQLELSFVPLYDGGMLIDEAIGRMYADGYRLAELIPGFAVPKGRMLQADGLFVRGG